MQFISVSVLVGSKGYWTDTHSVEHPGQLQRLPHSHEGPAKDGVHARRIESLRMGRCPSHVHFMVSHPLSPGRALKPTGPIETAALTSDLGRTCCLPQ